jgi:hypothetical protein
MKPSGSLNLTLECHLRQLKTRRGDRARWEADRRATLLPMWLALATDRASSDCREQKPSKLFAALAAVVVGDASHCRWSIGGSSRSSARASTSNQLPVLAIRVG